MSVFFLVAIWPFSVFIALGLLLYAVEVLDVGEVVVVDTTIGSLECLAVTTDEVMRDFDDLVEATLYDCAVSLAAIELVFDPEPDPLSPEPDPLPDASSDVTMPVVIVVVDVLVAVLVAAVLMATASVILLDATEVLDVVEEVVEDSTIASLEVTAESMMGVGGVVETTLWKCFTFFVDIELVFDSDPDPLSPEPDPLPDSSLDAVVLVLVVAILMAAASVGLLDAIEVLDAVEVVIVETTIGSL